MKVDYRYKMGGKEAAARNYNKRPSMATMILTVPMDNSIFQMELNVEEAEMLAQQLTEYANEIKEYAATLKEVEG